MEFNAEAELKRKFILVQLPEDLDEEIKHQNEDSKKETQELIDYLDSVGRCHLLSEIGKERLIQAGNANQTRGCDTGFRVFKLDDSNMNDVYYSAGEYTQDLLGSMESNVKEDRTDLDLLFGCLLEWGLPLSMPYRSEKIDGFTVHTYNDGDLIACFDENVPESVIDQIARRKPLRAVFRDSSFKDSPAKINVGEIFKMLAPETTVKVI